MKLRSWIIPSGKNVLCGYFADCEIEEEESIGWSDNYVTSSNEGLACVPVLIQLKSTRERNLKI